MRPLALICWASLLALPLVPLPAATVRMPLDEVHPGMTGVGITVFQGSKRETFEVHILGVLENVMGPRRSIIVARLGGEPLVSTGVIQGMSGSPVYIDGRLVGAVSYALGSFPKEAIAGITPIEDMVATEALPLLKARRHATPLQLPVTRDSLGRLVREAFQRTQPFARQTVDVRTYGFPASEGGRLGTLLQPIATPLVLNGFAPEVHELLASVFDAGGFVTMIGGAAPPTTAQAAEGAAPLEPGDPVGASLIRGDFTMTGTGTVTMVEGNRVYAFGHPFYNLGRAGFPMTRAYITTLLPSLASSSRIAAIGEVLGTFDQDRATGIYGTLGSGPELIPVTVTLHAGDRNLMERFNFEVIEDTLFTPLLAYTSVLNTFISWTRTLGASAHTVDGTVRVRGHADVTFRDVYSGHTAAAGAAAAITAPLTTLLNNAFVPVTLDGIDIVINSYEEPRTATLERVWLDTARPRAGKTVALQVLSRTYRGTEIVETVMIDLPPHTPGPLQILVSDAPQLTQREEQEGRHMREAQNLDQIILALNTARRGNRLYIKLLSPSAGAVVKGEELSALPSSVLAVLQGDGAGEGLISLHQATIGEWEISTDYVVTGSRLLTITAEAY